MINETIDTPEKTVEASSSSAKEIFPGVSDRIKAVFIDSLVIVAFMITIGTIFSKFENVPEQARILAFIFVFGLYDPIFTSIFGGTVGHFAIGLKVTRANNPLKKIMFPMAIIRYLFKATLGAISLISLERDDKCQAIHDKIAGSLVVYRKKK